MYSEKVGQVDLTAVPPRLDGIVAEEEPAEDGEHEGKHGNADEIHHETIAVDGVQRQCRV